MEQEQRIYNIIRENKEYLNFGEKDLNMIETSLMYSYAINKSLDLMLGFDKVVSLERLRKDEK